ncbi:acyltransferase [Luteimonas sp. 3794]|uniref:acyltransferase family protein n=1 Tax=Luteimonas sp. 3794 TaxID=2817730 RepID=UPI002867826A|nr:acyltransferase [Luteimonas sp. 3794]MDR6991848.1 peptidoglycan/LPS O-acetylase OafA/YrhL [Luteimonas sp. 3794]
MVAGVQTSPGRSGQLDVLDGLRGLAVLIVLASHFSGLGLIPRPAFHGVGKSGVYLFFVLSAYLLVRNLLRQPPGALRRADTWFDYALRRVLRIWPLYLVVLGLSWWTHSSGQTLLYPIDTASLWRHLALREGHSVLWSVPVEFKFYVLLPLVVVAVAAMARHRWPAWAQGLAFVTAVTAVTVAWPPAESIENTVSLWPYLAVFLCGAFTARVDAWLSAHPARRGFWTMVGVLALLAWCVSIPAIWCGLRGIPFEATITRTWYLFFGVLWSALLLALLHGHRGWTRLFAWRPLRWIGLVSFSLYLWHMPVLYALGPLTARLPLLAPLLVLGAALAVAAVSWWLLERPQRGIRYRRRTA